MEKVDVLQPPLPERLETLRGWYAATDNPLYAWEAFGECLAVDAPVPEWAKPYFTRVTAILADRKNVPAKMPGAAAKHVLHALELNVRGGPGPFRERLTWQQHNEARVRAALVASADPATRTSEKLLQTRYESELQELGHDPDTLQKHLNRNLPPDKT